MSVRSPRLRAILYSIPIPMTIALLGASPSGPGGQYLGVLLLVAFMYAVAFLEPRTGRVVAVASASAAYVGVAAAAHRWLDLPPVATFAASVCGLAALLLWRRRRPVSDEALTRGEPGPLEYAAVPVVTAATWALGGVLGPFVVTFPYSGVPTALAMRSGRLAFAAGFATQAGLLLGFLGLFHLAHRDLGTGASLTLAWAAFLGVSAWVNRRVLTAALGSAARAAPRQDR